MIPRERPAIGEVVTEFVDASPHSATGASEAAHPSDRPSTIGARSPT